jgi:hypothetical protein
MLGCHARLVGRTGHPVEGNCAASALGGPWQPSPCWLWEGTVAGGRHLRKLCSPPALSSPSNFQALSCANDYVQRDRG